ncbi:hypothetical protein VNO78_10991 [Psophocarpus tetragonolobus]|uniref:Uncharacterized protein n=1 Tax=Psophocarpus tetragonolobus TaxID=3891 RepID=A0AAN9SSN3_PSOTE
MTIFTTCERVGKALVRNFPLRRVLRCTATALLLARFSGDCHLVRLWSFSGDSRLLRYRHISTASSPALGDLIPVRYGLIVTPKSDANAEEQWEWT